MINDYKLDIYKFHSKMEANGLVTSQMRKGKKFKKYKVCAKYEIGNTNTGCRCRTKPWPIIFMSIVLLKLEIFAPAPTFSFSHSSFLSSVQINKHIFQLT